MSEQCTIVFNYDIRKNKKSPFHVDTPFGRPQIIEVGNGLLDQDAREVALREAHGTISNLLKMLEVAGASDDIMAELFPDAKKRNGRPVDENAKTARRTMNEARAALSRIKAVLGEE